MIAYFDTSAVVPLLISEPATDLCVRVWREADDVVTSRLTYVEAGAALAQARRTGRVSDEQHRGGLENLSALWASFRVVDVDEPLVERAAEVAEDQGLRAYDAVHGASAELVASKETVGVSGDQALLAAWSDLGLITIDVTRT
ncbi:type II toxin-antitoxin system VapC family toxin [Humibacter soli]